MSLLDRSLTAGRRVFVIRPCTLVVCKKRGAGEGRELGGMYDVIGKGSENFPLCLAD
jgi:hypothetical protein